MSGTGRSAVYHIYDRENVLLYVGVSDRFGARWEQHARTQPWWPEMHHQTVTWYPTRREAEHAEAVAITTEHPKYNVMKPVHAAQANPSASEDDLLQRYEAGEWVEVAPGHRTLRKTGANIGDWFPWGS
jgi:hypothetical protein